MPAVRMEGPPPSPHPGRPLSGMERLWLVADRIAPPFVIQLVLEGEGLPTPPAGLGWAEVLQTVARAQPGCRLRLAGALAGCRWQADGPLPALRLLADERWDGRSSHGAPFLQQPLDPRRGPVCELLLLPAGMSGQPDRLVLRTHHAATDGMGTLLLAEALFAVLRGEQPPVATAGPPSDAQLARSLQAARAPALPPAARSPTGAAQGPLASLEVVWARRRVAGRFTQLLPSLAVALARQVAVVCGQDGPEGAAEAAVGAGDPCRVGIPVDLRRHMPSLGSSANLTGLLHLPLFRLTAGATLDPQAARDAVAEELQRQLGRRAELETVAAASFARWLPLAPLAWAGGAAARRALRLGRYGATAALSSFGRLKRERLSGGGFTARRAFVVPPGNPALPLFLTSTGDPEGVELVAAMPAVLAGNGRLEALLEALAGGLVEEGEKAVRQNSKKIKELVDDLVAG